MAMGMSRSLAHTFGMYGYGWLFEIIFLVIFVLIIYWIVSTFQKNESALEILNKRYAQGELSKKEYLSLKNDILGVGN